MDGWMDGSIDRTDVCAGRPIYWPAAVPISLLYLAINYKTSY